MNEFNIRKDLPSIKVDIELIEQLESYILTDIPAILGIKQSKIIDEFSIEIVDSLGTGVFNSISEFPMTLFQDGTQEVSFGFSIYEEPYCRVKISFDKDSYSSKIDISLKTTNPREKAQGIYNGIMDRINQHKTYNFIFHKIIIGFIGGLGIALIPPIIMMVIKKNYVWASLLTIAAFIIVFLAYKGPKLKPYSEFSTNTQIRNNRIFSFFIWGFISYLVFGLGFGILKETIFK